MTTSLPVGVASGRWLDPSRRSTRRGRATEPRASSATGGATTTAEATRARPRVVQRKDTLEDDASGDVFSALSAPPSWASASTNPPLMGNFAPVVGECEIGDLEVEGTIPASVRGVYLRNGPNPAREPLLGAARYHWFDGDGMLHWIRLGDDDESSDDALEEKKKSPSSPSSASAAASYGRAYVRTKNFEREASLGESLYTGLRDITPVWRVLLPRLFTKVFEDWKSPDSPFWVVQSKNTANNGVKAHAGVLLATYESGSAYELELSRRLTTLGVCDFKKSFATKDYWLDNMTAHAKTCPKTGELVYMGYNLISLDFDAPRDEKTTDVVVGVVDKHGARTSRRVIKMSRPSMQHDVGITRSRVVLLDGPLVFDLNRVLTGGLPFAFETDQSMRIGILPRAAARVGENDEENKNKEDVVWVDTGEPCFAYHVVNCYDDPADPDVVVVDVCKSDGTNALGMARGFDDDADGQGWMPAGSFVDGNKTKTKNKNKNGYVGDDATGVVDENAFEALVNKAVGFFSESSFASSKERDPRDARRENAPELGSHANAVGHGRDVAALWRWRVDVRTKTMVSSERLCETPSDFPCVDPRDVGAPHFFCYTAGYAASTFPKRRMDVPSFDKVHKHCLSTGKHYTYCLDENRACGDVAFVPDHDKQGGHLLVLTHDVAQQTMRDGVVNGVAVSASEKKNERSPTELLILADDRDERNPALRLVGKVKIPVRVPFGFHNEFVAEAELPQGKW